ncbi:MAG: glutamine--fructose-6-phosphate transaminase (isomerizing) [Gammaproteobacteria bacterium]
MCGIVGGVAQRDVAPILLEGLRRLEYRGYDSAGMAVLHDAELERLRRVGKVAQLADALQRQPLNGMLGIAHTRWATHGQPSEQNAHPHICNKHIAVVHNGIIENHEALREGQRKEGFRFTSETDTEVVAHQIEHHLQHGSDLLDAVRKTIGEIQGAYAIGVISADEPHRLVAAREGSPLVIGIGIGEHFIASDVQALLPVTQRFVYLENGDVADLRPDGMTIYDRSGQIVERPVYESALSATAAERGNYRHFMLKEIHEQSQAIADTLESRIVGGRVPAEILGPRAGELIDQVKAVQIVACGTSYHAGLIAKYWLETLTDLPCQVEVASEYRYRRHVVAPGTLFVTISQSGETADTLAALQAAKSAGYVASLAICNVPESSLVRASDLVLMTHAGPELGVASTKAFTTQLVALLLFVIAGGRAHGMTQDTEKALIGELEHLPAQIEDVLKREPEIEAWAQAFANLHHALYLGRGIEFPIAMEGALKLKEISYIHAEAYPAGELKHGPLALVDEEMPVIAVAPNDSLLEKLLSNLQEVRARGGKLFVFTSGKPLRAEADVQTLELGDVGEWTAPIVFSVPLQLLAYHVAVLKGTDVDQPRNLAKSVTVE